jgi:hypothetical protein
VLPPFHGRLKWVSVGFFPFPIGHPMHCYHPYLTHLYPEDEGDRFLQNDVNYLQLLRYSGHHSANLDVVTSIK